MSSHDHDPPIRTAQFSPPMTASSECAAADLDAYSFSEFCRRNMMSRDKLYDMLRRGEGPEIFYIGAHPRISKESAARWRRAQERATREQRSAKFATVSNIDAPKGSKQRG